MCRPQRQCHSGKIYLCRCTLPSPPPRNKPDETSASPRNLIKPTVASVLHEVSSSMLVAPFFLRPPVRSAATISVPCLGDVLPPLYRTLLSFRSSGSCNYAMHCYQRLRRAGLLRILPIIFEIGWESVWRFSLDLFWISGQE